MSEAREIKIKRLAMRSMRRGIKEMDLILSDFAARHLDGLSDADLDTYDSLLSEPDLEIYGWILGQDQTPDRYADMLQIICAGAEGLVAPQGQT